MIDERLLQQSYYLDKLSMYFKSSHGIEEQFEMIRKMLVAINSSINDMFDSCNIMSESIVELINSYDETGLIFDLLDKIASIYGVSRKFSVSYKSGATTITKNLNLTNYELLVLIRARIIQNTYKGTYEECMKMYELINLQDNIIVNFDVNDATCNIFLRPVSSTFITEPIIDMFLAGFLTLKSLGIVYNHSYYDISTIGIWNSTNWDSTTRKWY